MVCRHDILRGLYILTKLGYTKDERMKDALKVLILKQTKDKKWILESTPTGRIQTSLEANG